MPSPYSIPLPLDLIFAFVPFWASICFENYEFPYVLFDQMFFLFQAHEANSLPPIVRSDTSDE